MIAISNRLARHDDRERATRRIADTQVAIHCHHYNSRFLATIEGAVGIDGAGLVENCARRAFQPLLAQCRRSGDSREQLLELAEEVYRIVGLGTLGLSELAEGRAVQDVSHIVEGYRAGFHAIFKKACSLSCGFIEAVCAEYLGDDVVVEETACMLEGAAECTFVVAGARAPSKARANEIATEPGVAFAVGHDVDSNVDAASIVDALLKLDVSGDASGLAQAFGVYLANMPVDFYNLATIAYVDSMRASGRGKIAVRLLANDAETCGLNTFRGVMQSAEWKSITGDTLQNSTDTLVALAAVCRALGWGELRVREHIANERATFELAGGYEAIGMLAHRGKSEHPSCPMLTGVAAGIVELVDGTGAVIDRAGQYTTVERTCQACGDERCRVEVWATK